MKSKVITNGIVAGGGSTALNTSGVHNSLAQGNGMQPAKELPNIQTRSLAGGLQSSSNSGTQNGATPIAANNYAGLSAYL